VLGDGGREGDDIVLSGLFDFFDPRDIEGAAVTDVRAASGGTMPAAAVASAAAVSPAARSRSGAGRSNPPISVYIWRSSKVTRERTPRTQRTP
jgi:hypothetical protein